MNLTTYLTDKYLNKHVEVDNPLSNFNGDGGIVCAVDQCTGYIDVRFPDGQVVGFFENELALAE